jgi:UDPglucose 6-dehydrogenase
MILSTRQTQPAAKSRHGKARMKPSLSVLGLGYVGLVTSAAFASKRFKVVCYDTDVEKVEAVKNDVVPFFEPGLSKLVKDCVKSRYLRVATDPEEAVLESDATFITVGTPSKEDGSIDLSYLQSASRAIGQALGKRKHWHLLVVKSTMLPGTTDTVVKPAVEKLSGLRCPEDFGLCANPEFLREGSAVHDTLKPDRIVIGEIDERSGSQLESLYRRFHGKPPPLLRTTAVNAELIKYASNAFLATKVSFINMIANLCQTIRGADVNVVAKGMGLDKRINPFFLKAGLGWGGSCFPKDLRALSKFTESTGVTLPLVEATIEVNDSQPLKGVQLAEEKLGKLQGKRVALLGLSFKPGTSDMRGAPSIRIVEELLKRGADVVAYDPIAIDEAKRIFNRLPMSRSALECIQDADCCIIVTEWAEFARLSPHDFTSKMRNPVVIDGRRILDSSAFSRKLTYAAIGLGPTREPK